VSTRIEVRRHQRDRHPGTVQVPDVGEYDVRVIDAFVGLPELLALLERHVPAVTLPPGARDDARWPRDIILRPGRWRKLVQERRRWRGGRHAAAAR
jgi:hypothetical protein